ncbi:sulfotransferase family protein [Parahaliea mediterranea]|uniref:Sulfotransferase n=1 Tax=Parahaliea mediterranea TaxID=651086 RepID=A0A939DH68_9GAMM|nr:sulfotransferase [Parahaliea mediterranea]MBN7797437.1 sulfotransferase [Parahaliea mediterranea]
MSEDVAAPVFILGAQRSGTTMLRLMLNAHGRLCVPHESVFITELYPRLDEFGDLSQRENRCRLIDVIAAHPQVKKGGLVVDIERLKAAEVDSYPALVREIFREYMVGQGKSVWCDKSPSYTEDIDVLCRMFPDARFVHLVRDGRDVAMSQLAISWGSNNLPRIARDWRWQTMVCHKVGAVLPADRFMELRYEDLVLEPEQQLRRICQFLNVPFDPGMLDYHRSADKAVPRESLQWHRNSVSRPNVEKVLAWKTTMRRSDRVIFEQIAGDALASFGYECLREPADIRSRLRNLYFNVIARY